jgi:RNA polymerase sigma-70 factor, ECF subfamily
VLEEGLILPRRPGRAGPTAAWPAAAEARLTREAASGSEAARGELFRRHWARAHQAAWLITHDAQGAEDVAQEAFLAAFARLDSFDRRRPFGPWLHRIVVNRAIDFTRARTARREVGADVPAAAVEEAPAVDVVAALARLGPEQRAVVVLRHLLGYSPGEIAGLLDLPRGTVNSRLRRALDALAELLQEEQ